MIAVAFTHIGRGDVAKVYEFQSHVGTIYFILMASTVVTGVVLLKYIAERPLVAREIFTGHYSMYRSYAMSRFTIDSFTCAIQSIVFVLTAYFALELQSNIWMLFFLVFTSCMVGASIAVAIGSCTKDPRAARYALPAILLPQTLFSGIFVTLPPSMPIYVRWISFLMPLTYLFRLGIYYEFLLSCQEYSSLEDKYVADCANLLIELDEKVLLYEYHKNSTFLLAQAVFDEGQNDIKEYVDFISEDEEHPASLVVNFCRVRFYCHLGCAVAIHFCR